jgi:hypothetical protein
MSLLKKIKKLTLYAGIALLFWNCSSDPVNSIRMGYNRVNKSIVVVYNLEGSKKTVFKLNVGLRNAATGKMLSVPQSNLSTQLDGISPGNNKKFEISTENLNINGGGFEVKISAIPVGRKGSYVPPALPEPIVVSPPKTEVVEKGKPIAKPAAPKPQTQTQTVRPVERPKPVAPKKVVEKRVNSKPAPRSETQKLESQDVQVQSPKVAQEESVTISKASEAPNKTSKSPEIKNLTNTKSNSSNRTFLRVGISPFDVGAKQTSRTLSLSIGQAGNKNGWYVSGKMSLASSESSKYEVDVATNKLANYNSSLTYYLFGSESSTSRLSVTGGFLVGLSKDVYWTMGAGYGQRNLLWSFNEYNYSQIGQSIGQSWALNKKSSTSGLELESGLMVLSGPVNFNVNYSILGILGGASNKFSDLQVGIGFNF